MPEPTVCAFVFVALKDSVHRRSMMNLIVELCSYQIVECAHIASKSGEVMLIGALMNRAQLLNEINHQRYRTTYDPAIQQRFVLEFFFILGIIRYVISQMS